MQASLIPATQRSKLILITLAYVGFISLGLPDGLLGVGWPSIRETFNLSLDALGALLTTFTVGYLLSSFSSGRMLSHIGVGVLLTLSGFATAISLLGYAVSPGWFVMVGLGVLAGLGAGAIDAGLNTYVATHHSARTLNWLHAAFGVGAAAGPLVMTAVLQSGLVWRWGYVIVGAAQVALALCFLLTRRRWETPGAGGDGIAAATTRISSRTTLRLPAVWLSICLFFIYTGTEIAAGQWSYSLLTQSRGVPEATAGVWVSLYWGALTVGRILFGLIAGLASLALLLRLSLGTIVAGAILIWADAGLLSLLGLVLMGLALAPIFPSLIGTTPARLGAGHAANAVGFQVAAAALGGAALPGLVGILAESFSLEVVGPVLVVGSLIMVVLYEVLTRQAQKALR
jgi:fucose permease